MKKETNHETPDFHPKILRYLDRLHQLVDTYLDGEWTDLLLIVGATIYDVLDWRDYWDFPHIIFMEEIERWTGYSPAQMMDDPWPPVDTSGNPIPCKDDQTWMTKLSFDYWFNHKIRIRLMHYGWHPDEYAATCPVCRGKGHIPFNPVIHTKQDRYVPPVGITLDLDRCEMLPRPEDRAICHVCHGTRVVPLSYIVATEAGMPNLSSEDKPEHLLPDVSESDRNRKN